jgi:8-oxo-dGTP pyrophosphatase MutT (NUDIX family)
VRQRQAIPEILLITSRDTGRWVIPKGWPMKKRKPHQVAQQEALEEAGIVGQAAKRSFGSYQYEKRLSGGDAVTCVVKVHLLSVSDTVEEFAERGQRQMTWMAPRDAAKEVNEPELSKLMERLADEFEAVHCHASAMR